ncbi:Rac GTPase-activating protein 1 [Araneus ventricosus]|uniref:Rac GTPase-activating protein 1 n=1 Tax=Araneus ventricosus TaxID=182803 RepID=A0A4Y2PKA3_ARAVE|nr:Rac GTPase-activating protein 1 [Araneus ventricosus]
MSDVFMHSDAVFYILPLTTPMEFFDSVAHQHVETGITSITSDNKTHIHVLCGAIKSFLRSLKEPLIPTSAWQSFVKAAELEDQKRSLRLLYNLVCDLPQPNKETLAFLLQHLQRVSESVDCQMPVDNLAKVLGPTIVGYSSPSLSSAKLFKETFQQRPVMKKLLMLPPACWQAILDKDLSANSKRFSIISAIKASDSASASNNSGNEPVYTSVQKDRFKARKDKRSLRSS